MFLLVPNLRFCCQSWVHLQKKMKNIVHYKLSKSCQRLIEIFLFSKYHCRTLTVELELDVSVCAQLKIFTNKNSLTWLNFTKTLYFDSNNISQIDVKREIFVSQEKTQGKTKNSVVMNLNVSADDINICTD